MILHTVTAFNELCRLIKLISVPSVLFLTTRYIRADGTFFWGGGRNCSAIFPLLLFTAEKNFCKTAVVTCRLVPVIL